MSRVREPGDGGNLSRGMIGSIGHEHGLVAWIIQMLDAIAMREAACCCAVSIWDTSPSPMFHAFRPPAHVLKEVGGWIDIIEGLGMIIMDHAVHDRYKYGIDGL